MKRRVGLLALFLAAGACESPPVTVNIEPPPPPPPPPPLGDDFIEKSIFEGEWWMTRTLASLPDDGARALAAAVGPFGGPPFEGMSARLGPPSSPHAVARVAWWIGEHEIVAYRSSDASPADAFGEPVAAFAVIAHAEGEPAEDTDTGASYIGVLDDPGIPWSERRWIHVDWSHDLAAADPYGATPEGVVNDLAVHRYPVIGVSRLDLRTLSADPVGQLAHEWPAGSRDTVTLIDVRTREVWTPMFCDDSLCFASVELGWRTAFMRIPPAHAFAPHPVSDAEVERFGMSTTGERTLAAARDPAFCNTDAACGSGHCDLDTHLCSGGVHDGPHAVTQRFAYQLPLWRDGLGPEQGCIADWQCDGSYGGAGALPGAAAGSRCDLASGRCTIAAAQRNPEQVSFYLSANFPRHLVRSAFIVVAEWNETLMHARRVLLGQALPGSTTVPCQRDDPTQWCYCDDSLRAPEVGDDARCPSTGDYFRAPGDRGQSSPYGCWIEGPSEPAHPYALDSYGNEVANYRMTGGECAITLATSPCGRGNTDPETCDLAGDPRARVIAWESGAGPELCAETAPLMDPSTGESIVTHITLGGACIETLGSVALTLWPVLRGELDAGDLFGDRDLAAYFIARGRVPDPGVYAGLDALPTDPAALIEPYRERLTERVARGELGVGDRLSLLAGSAVEDRAAQLLGAELDVFALLDPTPERRASSAGVPLFSDGLDEVLRAPFAADARTARLLQSYPREAHLTARYQTYWAEAFRNRLPPEAQLRWEQALTRAFLRHHLGHALGLRLNLAASMDRDHYSSGWLAAVTRDPDGLAFPSPSPFDADLDGVLTGAELHDFREARRDVESRRLSAGLGNRMSSSVMDRAGDLSDLAPVGAFDRAAVAFNIYGLAEVFAGDPTFAAGAATSLEGLLRSDVTPRHHWRWYAGGETCSADADCPFAVMPEGTAAQTCRGRASPGEPCDGDGACVCSSFDDDVAALAAADPELYPVRYLSCSEAGGQSCAAYDAGESYREVVSHWRATYRDLYPHTHFRHGSAPPAGFAAEAARSFAALAALPGELTARVAAGDSSGGPRGVDEHLLATAAALDWLAELVNAPEPGAYVYVPDDDGYVLVDPDPEAAAAELSVRPGEGFFHGSRLAAAPGSSLDLVRAGVLWDQVLALRALTRRDAGASATPAGFYDVFGIEVTELFTGLISDDPRYVAPRVLDHGEGFVIEPITWMRGWCRDPSSGEDVPCRGDAPSTFPGPVVTPPPRTLLRIAAAAFALASLSTPTDPIFRLRASVYEVGADAFDVADTQEDGSTSCGYGGVLSAAHADCTPAPGATEAERQQAATSSDYIVYTPGGDVRTYAAVKLRPRTTFDLEEEHTAFHLLLRASELQVEARALEALASPTPEEEARLAILRARLEREDAFIDVLVRMRRLVD